MNTSEKHALFQEASRTLAITPQGFFGKNVKRFTKPPTQARHPRLQRAAEFFGLGTKRRLVSGLELQLRETLLKLQQQHKS